MTVVIFSILCTRGWLTIAREQRHHWWLYWNTVMLAYFCTSYGCFHTTGQNWVAATESMWPAKFKIFTIWIFGKICQLTFQTSGSFFLVYNQWASVININSDSISKLSQYSLISPCLQPSDLFYMTPLNWWLQNTILIVTHGSTVTYFIYLIITNSHSSMKLP